jgi:hypothetical protein
MLTFGFRWQGLTAGFPFELGLRGAFVLSVFSCAQGTMVDPQLALVPCLLLWVTLGESLCEGGPGWQQQHCPALRQYSRPPVGWLADDTLSCVTP